MDRLISSRNLTTRFRPVVSLKSCQVFGHIVRVYGQPDSSTRDMPHYFAVARELDLVDKLCKCYFEAVFTRFKAGEVMGCLLLPLPAVCLEDLDEELARLLAKTLKKQDIPAQRIKLLYPGGPDNYSGQQKPDEGVAQTGRGPGRTGHRLRAG